jgi:serine/threonine protein kinase
MCIVHRDLKPENIFMDVNGTIKVGQYVLRMYRVCTVANVSSYVHCRECIVCALSRMYRRVCTVANVSSCVHCRDCIVVCALSRIYRRVCTVANVSSCVHCRECIVVCALSRMYRRVEDAWHEDSGRRTQPPLAPLTFTR